MMKQLLFILFIFLGLSSCDKKGDTFSVCEFSDPLEDLAWLKEFKETLIDCGTQISIFQATYKKQTVFFSMITDPLANSAFGIVLWDCEGNVVKRFKYDDREEFDKLVLTTALLYRCKEDSEGL